eukprot:4529993-Prymnesium_polylepis.2
MFQMDDLATASLEPNIQTVLEEMYSQSSLITWAMEVPHQREIRQRFQFICYSLLYQHPPDGLPASHLIEVYIPDLITTVMPGILQYNVNPAEVGQSRESFTQHMEEVGSWLSAQWFRTGSDVFYSLPPILIDFPLDKTLDSREVLSRVKQFARHRTISPNAPNARFWHKVTHACQVLLVLEQFSTDAWANVVPHDDK